MGKNPTRAELYTLPKAELLKRAKAFPDLKLTDRNSVQDIVKKLWDAMQAAALNAPPAPAALHAGDLTPPGPAEGDASDAALNAPFVSAVDPGSAGTSAEGSTTDEAKQSEAAPLDADLAALTEEFMGGGETAMLVFIWKTRRDNMQLKSAVSSLQAQLDKLTARITFAGVPAKGGNPVPAQHNHGSIRDLKHHKK